MTTKRVIIGSAVGLGIVTLTLVSLLAARALQYAGSDFEPGTRNGALLGAIQANDLLAVRVLLVAGADPNAVLGYPILAYAAQEGNVRAVTLLLRSGALPDGPSGMYTWDRPMFGAAAYGHSDVVDILKQHRAKYTPVDALFIGDATGLRDALANDPEVFSALKYYQNSVLFAAVQFHNVNATKTLLDLGFDPTKPGRDGYSALEFARRTGDTELIRLIETFAIAESPPKE